MIKVWTDAAESRLLDRNGERGSTFAYLPEVSPAFRFRRVGVIMGVFSMFRVLLSLFFLGASVVFGQSAEHLSNVKKIFVGTMGEGEYTDIIRTKIVSHLVKSGKLEVVNSEAEADAILIGLSQVSHHEYSNASVSPSYGSAHAGTKYNATAGVQLLGKNGKILWADDVSNGMFARSVSSSVADKISKNLIKALQQSLDN